MALGWGQIWPQCYNLKNLIETHCVKLHAKFGSSKPYGYWQEDFQRFQKFLSFVAISYRVFEGIKFFQKIMKKTMQGTFLWNFIKIGWVVSEKMMFKVNVNAQTDTWTAARTTDNRPCYKLAGLWSLELIKWNYSLTLYHRIPTFNDPEEEGLGKHSGKRRKYL